MKMRKHIVFGFGKKKNHNVAIADRKTGHTIYLTFKELGELFNAFLDYRQKHTQKEIK